jgi:hypothetical protein
MPSVKGRPQQVARPRRVFGLGIDEAVQWVVADVTGPAPAVSDTFEWGTFEIDIAGPSKEPCFLEIKINECLQDLRRTRPELFDNVEGLGVSTIGVVNQREKRLRSIARKIWIRADSEDLSSPDYLIDFPKLFSPFFQGSSLENLEVRNDATAKGLVEYNLSQNPDASEVESILYLMFDEGVNGGIIVGSSPLSSLLHPEMGHIRPRPHDLDTGFSLGSKACPTHEFCFEAIASAARIRLSWGEGNPPPLDFNISDLGDTHPAWEIISYYVAQLCMIGTLMLAPELIILGGCVITGRPGDKDSRTRNLANLLPLIHANFTALNGGYLFYDEMAAAGFIQPARVVKNSNVIAALHVACLAAYPEVVKGNPIRHWTIIAGGKQ